MAQILMVLTSHNQLGDTGRPTGYWLEELAAPYYVFLEAGHEVVLASPAGGLPPLDPLSSEPENLAEAGRQFLNDETAQLQLAQTVPLAEIHADDFDAVFYPGGHGPLWDLAENPHSIALIETLYAAGKPIASICHGPAVLLCARTAQGNPLVANRQVTCFSNAEETEVGLHQVVPYLLEDELMGQGANYVRGPEWQDFSIADGYLITGQNPASAESCANKLLELLETAKV